VSTHTAFEEHENSASPSPVWRTALLSLALALAGLVFVFREPIAGAVSLWWHISTYNHAFLILPISLLLISEKKEALKAVTPAPSFWGLAVMAGFAFVWLGSYAADVAEGEHFAILGMIEALLLTVLGARVFRLLLFPFLYLWLMVPTGTFLLPTLQWLSTVQVEALLHFSGIPVFTQNTLIQVPGGLYTVAPGCAGLNFIFTALALAPLYAYYMYTGLAKRLAAVGIMIVVAILANAVRIFAIISLVEFTNKRIDIVDDHLLYGWGFFALVLAVMALIGWRFADDPEGPHNAAPPRPEKTPPSPGYTKAPALAAVLALLIAILPAAWVAARQRPDPAGRVTLSIPATAGAWRQAATETDWKPVYPSAHNVFLKSYAAAAQCCVDLYIAYYQVQTKNREVVAEGNRVSAPAHWRSLETRHQTVDLKGTPLRVSALTITSGARQRLVWRWFWVDGTLTSNPLLAKLLEARANLLWGDTRAAAILLSAEFQSEKGRTDARLRDFLETGPDIRRMVEGARWTPQDKTPEDDGK